MATGKVVIRKPSTILVPSFFDYPKWASFSESDQIKIFKYHVLSGKLSLDDLLALSPGAVLGTANAGQVVTKLDVPGEVYLKTATQKDGCPINVGDIANTTSIVAHGDFFMLVPKNV